VWTIASVHRNGQTLALIYIAAVSALIMSVICATQALASSLATRLHRAGVESGR
jgi:hypothetical protein